MVKPHYQTSLSILQGIDPRQSESAHNAQSHYQPMFQSMSEIKSRKMNLENKCAMVEKQYLPYSAPNALIDCIAVIHMDGEEGRRECSFDPQCHRLAEIMGLYDGLLK